MNNLNLEEGKIVHEGQWVTANNLAERIQAQINANRRILERLGYSVTTTLDSCDALDIFTENPDAFDLVITDMTMPHMTGAELSSELLKTKPDIPIILCTGYS